MEADTEKRAGIAGKQLGEYSIFNDLTTWDKIPNILLKLKHTLKHFTCYVLNYSTFVMGAMHML